MLNMWANVTIFPADLTIIGSELHRVGPATEKVLVPTLVLTLETKVD